MLQNYFRTAWRNLVRNKVYSLLNILGLAMGMTVALVIGLWVYYQYSYDRFLPHHTELYKTYIKTDYNGATTVGGATPLPLADALRKDIPGIQYVAQTDLIGEHALMVGDKKLYPIVGAMAGGDFLQMFQYPLLKGNAASVLRDPYSIVLSGSTARALFGGEDPINKTVRIDNNHDLKVTGVLKDVPGNSTLQFSFVVPFSFYVASNDWIRQLAANWHVNPIQTFVTLRAGFSYAQVEPGLKTLVKKYDPQAFATSKEEIIMQPARDWHLYTDFRNGIAVGGLIDYVRMFSVIGLLVLFIACINFMNLSTARSEKRAREVGVRKTLGSRRADLVFQFLIESLVLTFIAFILSLAFAQLVLPFFNILARTTLRLPYTSGVFWLIMMSYVLVTGLLAGSKPAFYLSSLRPIKVLKSAMQAGKAATLQRKSLVVLQFACSITLIISTIVVYQQIQYAKDRPLGYDASRLVMTGASDDLRHNYNVLKNDLMQSGLVISVTRASTPITELWSYSGIDNWEGKLPGESLGLGTIVVADTDYFKTLGMPIREGRNFMGNIGADSAGVILNEAAVKRMRFKEGLNQAITWHDGMQRVRVIGVAKDALMSSPFEPAQPTIFVYDPGWPTIITYRLSPDVNTREAIARIGALFNKYNPSYSYVYHFVDESYAEKFSLETLIGQLSGLFAVLAVFISCLGLFGLAVYTAEQRTKEVGIRKVLGASVLQVWVLLSKDFIVLVLISCVIASPVAYYFLHDWLQQYEYRIGIHPAVFAVSAVLAVGITVLTISFQAVKAALANPVKSLRAEG